MERDVGTALVDSVYLLTRFVSAVAVSHSAPMVVVPTVPIVPVVGGAVVTVVAGAATGLFASAVGRHADSTSAAPATVADATSVMRFVIGAEIVVAPPGPAVVSVDGSLCPPTAKSPKS